MYKILDTPRLEKHANQIWTFDKHGTPMVKQASRNDIIASEVDMACLTPDMRCFIEKDFRPDPMFCYLVVNALSDEETFGANVNGDGMPRYSKYGDPLLINETRTHGYKTYELMGHWFHHHKNRDPKFAAGFVLFSSYDLNQGIVRILVGIDRTKDPETCFDIDRGIMPLTSMGLKVPFDICSACSREYGTRDKIERLIHEWYCDESLRCKFLSPGEYALMHNSMHRDRYRKNIPGLSRWTTEYCDHLKHNMGVIDDSGFQIYAINHLPRLFDISKVFVNADKVSQGIFKVAGARKPYATGIEWDDLSGTRGSLVSTGIKEQPNMIKTAVSSLVNFIKESEDIKTGAIEKDAPTQGEPKVLSPEKIKEIRSETAPVMDAMDSECIKHRFPENFFRIASITPIKKVMSTVICARTPPAPHEFQRLFLDGQGMSSHRKMLDDKNLLFSNINFPQSMLEKLTNRFRPVFEDMFQQSTPDERLMEMLGPLMPERSFLPHAYFPRMKRTIIMIKSGSMPAPLPPSPMNFEDFKKKEDLNKEVESRNPFSLLETLAIAAAAYPFLRTALGKAIGQVQKIESVSPTAMAALAGGGLAASTIGDYLFDAPSPEETTKISSVLIKTGRVAEYLPWSKSIGKAYLGSLATIPAIHAYSLHQRRRAQRGEQLGDINRWIAMNPDVLSLAYFAGAPIAGRAIKSKIPTMFKGGVSTVARSMTLPVGLKHKTKKDDDYSFADKALGAATWGMMAPGRFLPSAIGGIIDTSILNKLLG